MYIYDFCNSSSHRQKNSSNPCRLYPYCRFHPKSNTFRADFSLRIFQLAYHSNHLLPADSRLCIKLVVPAHGVTVLTSFYNTVQDKCAICPLIKYDLVFFQFLRQCFYKNLISALMNGRLHTGTLRVKRKCTAFCQNLTNHRFHVT